MEHVHVPPHLSGSPHGASHGGDATSPPPGPRIRRLYLLTAALLQYPGDPDFWADLPSLRDQALRDGWPELARCVDRWLAGDALALARVYVESFDLHPGCALYLTAHECGESRDRGHALWLLHHQLQSRGWEPELRELPDFVPALLEYIAMDWEGACQIQLPHRLGRVLAAIAETLGTGHPYAPPFQLTAAHLPAAAANPTSPTPAQVDHTVPYPLLVTDPDDTG